ncbi:MAG: hypothetical protein ACK5NF_02535 [Bacilli bacterium]
MGRRSIKQISSNKRIIKLLIPFLFFFTLIFGLGLIEVLKSSFGIFEYTKTNITFDYYIKILTDVNFYKSLLYTIYLGVIPTFLSVTIGVLLASIVYLNCQRIFRGFKVLLLPNIISYSICTFVVILIFMQTGIISRILFNTGIINNPNAFPLFIYDKYGIGIMLVYLLKQVPFVFLIVYSTLLKRGNNLIKIAKILGANNTIIIFKIIIAGIKTTIYSVGFLCFAFNFGSFEVPFILGNPKYESLSLMAYKYYSSPSVEQKPLAMVINVIILCISIAILYLFIKKREKSNETRTIDY